MRLCYNLRAFQHCKNLLSEQLHEIAKISTSQRFIAKISLKPPGASGVNLKVQISLYPTAIVTPPLT